MANNIIGRFYFKLTDSKNLIGEFSNNHETCKRNYTESADRISPIAPDANFDGVYYTTWHDEIGSHKSVLAKLIIKRKFENIFSLEWLPVQDDKFYFWGEGILCDGILIGDYRDFEKC